MPPRPVIVSAASIAFRIDFDRVDHGLVERVDPGVVHHPEREPARPRRGRGCRSRSRARSRRSSARPSRPCARSEAGSAATRSHWPGRRSTGRDHDDDRATTLRSAARRERHDVGADRLADGDPVDPQPDAAAVVRLHEHTERPAVLDDARRRPDPAFERDTPCPCRRRPIPPRSALRVPPGERGDVLRPDVETVDVVEEAVPGLADDREAPVPLARRLRRDQRVADDSDRVRVRRADRGRQRARVADPLETRRSPLPLIVCEAAKAAPAATRR